MSEPLMKIDLEERVAAEDEGLREASVVQGRISLAQGAAG